MAPLTKPRPTGMARSKREIKNFAGMSLTKELTKRILRGPPKVPWVNSFVKLLCYLTKGFGGPPVTKPRTIGLDHPKREIKNLAGMSLTKALTEEILRGPLKFLWLIPLLNYTAMRNRVSKGGPPLTKPRPIAMARSKREIKIHPE